MKYLTATCSGVVLSLFLVLGVGCCSKCNPPTMAPTVVYQFTTPFEASLGDEVVSPYVEVLSKEDMCIGAGTVVEVKGEKYILTAGHVAKALEKLGDGGTRMHIRKESELGGQYQTWEVEIVKVRYDEVVDLALLKPLDSDGLVAARYYGDVKLKRGEDCWYMGTNGGIHSSLEKSIINRPDFFASRKLWYDGEGEEAPQPIFHRVMFNGNIYYGNSGGGLFVRSGCHYVLVGVVVELARPGEKSPGEAVTQEDICAFVRGR